MKNERKSYNTMYFICTMCVTHSGVYISGAIVLGIYVNEVKAPRLGPVSIGKTEIS